MLAAVRRYGVFQALRTPVSRSVIARSTVQQPLKLQPSSKPAALPQLYRSLHVSSPLRSAEAAQAQPADTEAPAPQRLTEFADLESHGLVDRRIISRITKGMGISTMTDVQSMTINETLHGDDVYVISLLFLSPRWVTGNANFMCSYTVWLKQKPEPERPWLFSFQ